MNRATPARRRRGTAPTSDTTAHTRTAGVEHAPPCRCRSVSRPPRAPPPPAPAPPSGGTCARAATRAPPARAAAFRVLQLRRVHPNAGAVLREVHPQELPGEVVHLQRQVLPVADVGPDAAEWYGDPPATWPAPSPIPGAGCSGKVRLPH
ncbi:unnamed protein product [Urochloa humidicola]